MLGYAFMQRALLVGVLLAVSAGYLGAFVVQRRLSFLGDGLAHAAFGGIALGLLAGIQPLSLGLPFTVFVALAIVWTKQRTDLASDTAIGVFFSISVSLGVLFLSFRKGYGGDAMSYLFGSLLLVSWQDVAISAALLGACLLSTRWWGRWAMAGCDRDLAATDGLKPTKDDYFLMLLIAVAVVASVKVVGAILTSAFLIIPAASARILTRTFFSMAWLAVAISALGTVIGLALSFWWNLPSGPSIVLLQGALFLTLSMVRRRDR